MINNIKKKYKGLKVAFIITISMMFFEFIGGLLANSVALISDAGHMLTDSIAIALSLAASIFSAKPPNKRRTYGHHRFEILAALINGASLIIISVYIFYESYKRFLSPPQVKGLMMLSFASFGLAANLVGIYFLKKDQDYGLNIHSAFLHMLGDTLSSIGVIIGGFIIYFTNWRIIDPIIGVLIGGIILKGAIELVIESGNILLESVPKNISLEDVHTCINKINGVVAVHDLHLWSITSELIALSAHIIIEDQKLSEGTRIINDIKSILKNNFNIAHTTLQLECNNCDEYPLCDTSIK